MMDKENQKPEDTKEPLSEHGEDKNNQDAPLDSSKVDQVEDEIEELKDQLLRALAETENVRNRSEKLRSESAKYAITSFAKEIVSVADNLQRTLLAAPEQTEDKDLKTLLEGVKMTERDLKATLERFEIKGILPLGEKFDHNLHQAIFETVDEEKEAGTIIEVIQEGYLISDRLLRPAMVGVTKKAEIQNSEEES